jgi:hypothetical protein
MVTKLQGVYHQEALAKEAIKNLAEIKDRQVGCRNY